MKQITNYIKSIKMLTATSILIAACMVPAILVTLCFVFGKRARANQVKNNVVEIIKAVKGKA
jgi:hypothetical protein